MNPILFASTETKFDTNGLGVLSDAISCIVTEERNGSFELTMQYSVEGIHYADIADRSIILAKPSPTDDAQPFRVYRHTKPLNGIVTFYARHISYDLSGTPVGPFTATNVIDALNKLKTNAVIPCPFDFWTDKVTAASMNVRVPSDIFSLLGGQQGSVLDVYGGEYKFDGYTVRLYNERGTDRGVSIRYGKNLLDLEQEKNCANVCTGVYPYWVDSNGENLVQLEDKIVNAPGTYDFVRIKMLDLSSEWEEAPSTEQLKARAETYIKENNIGVPTISLTVSHAMLENTEEYKGQALLERIDLCDTARIEFPKLGVSASAKAVKTEFNALLNRYESITFGDARYTLADSAVDQKKALEESSNKASGLVAEAMKKLNEIVQNSSGLYTTEEIQSDKSVIYYYHDKPNLTDSKNVIKFTADAIGLSTDGGKTYPFGFTVTGDMVANILSAIGVNANWINAGILQSMPDETGERNFIFDLATGLAEVGNLIIRGKNIGDTLDKTVVSVEQQYYKSDSPTDLIGGAWGKVQPEWEDGKYIWMRQKITYTDGNISYVGQYCMSKAFSDAAKNSLTVDDIVRLLTNNYQTQGFFILDGSAYVNAEYLRGKTIDLGLLRLIGTLCGLMQGYGSTKGGTTTEGIVIFGNGTTGDVANPPYIIITTAGIRGQSSRNGGFNMTDEEFEINGAFVVNKDGAGNGGYINLTNTYLVGNVKNLWSGSLGSGSIQIPSNIQELFNSYSAYEIVGCTKSGGSLVSSIIPKDQLGNKFQIADESNYISFTLTSSGLTVNNRNSSGEINAIYGIR